MATSEATETAIVEENIVYIAINEAMPGYVKIGRTNNIAQRIRTLDGTSIPLPFECFFAARVTNGTEVERLLHETFGDQRVRRSREFFTIAPERARAALKLAALEEVTPGNDLTETEEDRRVLQRARQRRANFNFEMVDIQPGAELVFTRDPEVKATVIGKRKVRFRGEELSLSRAAQLALEDQGTQWQAVSGPWYWEYEGETLDARRIRMEEEGDDN